MVSRGTTVSVVLPIHARPASEPPPSQRVPSVDMARNLLLVVDDEPLLRRAGKLSEDLVEAVGPRSRDGSKASYIIKKLDEADRAIQSRVGVKDMIGMTIQRVIHTITEGHDAGGDGEEGLSEGERVARRSLYFYRGLLEGAEFNFRVLGKMRKILSGS